MIKICFVSIVTFFSIHNFFNHPRQSPVFKVCLLLLCGFKVIVLIGNWSSLMLLRSPERPAGGNLGMIFFFFFIIKTYISCYLIVSCIKVSSCTER